MRIRGLFLVLLSSVFSLTPISGKALESIRVGVPDCHEHFRHEEIKQSFISAIKKTFGENADITVKEYPPSDMDLLMKNGRLDFILSSAGCLRALANFQPYVLATATYKEAPDPNYGDASSVFVLKDNQQLNKLQDLRGKSIAAKMPNGFTGWQAVEREVVKLGFDPAAYFAQKMFLGWKSTDVLDAVLNQKADAGVVQVCFLEKVMDSNPAYKDKFKVLKALENANKIDCSYSTQAYPNWTVSAGRHIDIEEANKLAKVLLSVTPAEAVQWSVGTSFNEVDTMLKELKLEPFDYLNHWSYKRFFQAYPIQLTLFFSVFLGLLMYVVAVNRLVKIRANQLTQAIKKKDQYKEQWQESNRKLEISRRLGLLSQVSSILVHELRQPLNTISCYSQGLLRRLDNDALKKEDLKKAIQEIHSRTKNANDVICKVRGFVKEGRKKEWLSVVSVIEETVSTYLLTSHSHELISVDGDKSIVLFIDKFELELIFMNLLRNSSEAFAPSVNGKIKISVMQKNDAVYISFSDNGKGPSKEFVSNMNQPYTSTKVEGLGIGLSIIREILHENGGSIQFSLNKSGGLTAEMTFDIPDQDDEKFQSPN